MGKKCSFVPKNVHLVLKNQKNCTFYTKNEVFDKNFNQNVQILDKKCSFVPKNVHLVLNKKQKNCTFYSKNEVFAKRFHQNEQILDKKCSFVPKNVHLVPKTKKNELFTLKIKFLPEKFTKMYKYWIQTVVL